jgi:hypothetical protein
VDIGVEHFPGLTSSTSTASAERRGFSVGVNVAVSTA